MVKNYKLKTLSLVTTCMILGVSAGASGTANATEINVGEIEVTATRTQKQLLDVNTSVSVITEEEIKKSGKNTVAEILKDVPGVEVVNSGSQGLKRVSIRGENPFRTLILVDGQRISEHKSMSGAAILVNVADIERIEVIKGASSVLYGSDSIGGVINIITKKGGKDKVNVDASMSYDSANDGFTENLALSGRINDFSYRLSGSYVDGNDLHTPKGTVKPTDFGQEAYNLYLAYDVTGNITLGAKGEYFDGKMKSADISSDDFYVDIPHWKRKKVSAFIDAIDLSEYLSKVNFNAYFQENEKYMNNHVGAAGMDSIALNKIKTYGTSIQTEWQLGDSNYLIWGASYEDETLNSHNDLTLAPTSMVFIKSNTYIHGTQNTFASFLSLESLIYDDYTLNLGMRYTYVESEVDDYQGSGYMQMGGMTMPYNPETTRGSNHDDKVVFNGGLIYTPNSSSSVRFNWGQGFRAPILQERYIISSMGGSTTYGNKDLKPETSNNFEVGYRFSNKEAFIDLAVFYNIADDYIDTMLNPDNTYTYQNISDVKTFGVELDAFYAFYFNNDASNLKLYTKSTFMRREFNDPTGVGSTFNTNIPALKTRYGIKYHQDFSNLSFDADIYGRSYSERKQDYVGTDAVLTNTYGGFTTAHLDMGLSFGEKRNYFVNASVNNIFDKYYFIDNSLPEPGVSVVLTLGASF